MHLEGINALLDYFGIWGAIFLIVAAICTVGNGCMAVAKDLTRALNRRGWPNLRNIHRAGHSLTAAMTTITMMAPPIAVAITYRCQSSFMRIEIA